MDEDTRAPDVITESYVYLQKWKEANESAIVDNTTCGSNFIQINRSISKGT